MVLLKAHGATVVSVGELVIDKHYVRRYGDKINITPVGYKALRPRLSAAKGTTAQEGSELQEGNANTITFSIVKTEGGPEFVISCGGDQPKEVRSSSASSAWQAWELTEEKVSEGKPVSSVTGSHKFAYCDPVVQDALRQLTGYEELVALAGPPKAPVAAVAQAAHTSAAPVAPGAVVVPVGAATAPAPVTPKSKGEGEKGSTTRRSARASTANNSNGNLIVEGSAAKTYGTTTPIPIVAATAVAGACSVCGLSTPFCAVTGKMHAVVPTPCAVCGMISLFCAQTGQHHSAQHAPAVTAPLQPPAPAPAAGRKKAARAETDGDKPPKGAKKPRTEGATTALPTDPSAVGGEGIQGVAEATAPPVKVRKQRVDKKQQQHLATLADGGAKRQITLEEAFQHYPGIHHAPTHTGGEDGAPSAIATAEAAAEGEVPQAPVEVVVVPPPPVPYQYAPPRPLLGKSDNAMFSKHALAQDPEVQKKMVDAGITTAAAQKRFLAFLASYTSEKAKLEMNNAFKGKQQKEKQEEQGQTRVKPAGGEALHSEVSNHAVAAPPSTDAGTATVTVAEVAEAGAEAEVATAES